MQPITVAVWSKAQTISASSDTGIVGLNPTQGIDFCVCVLCVGSKQPCIGQIPVQGVLSTVYRLRNWKRDQSPKGCRAIEREIITHH
jgi:hypothetical protein